MGSQRMSNFVFAQNSGYHRHCSLRGSSEMRKYPLMAMAWRMMLLLFMICIEQARWRAAATGGAARRASANIKEAWHITILMVLFRRQALIIH